MHVGVVIDVNLSFKYHSCARSGSRSGLSVVEGTLKYSLALNAV